MKVQDLPHRAVNTTLGIATLPVRFGIDATRRTRELLEHYDRRREASKATPAPSAKQPAEPKRSAKRKRPTRTTAAEAPEVVAEQTDGLAELDVAHQP